MQLLFTLIVGLVNLAAAFFGGYGQLPFLFRGPSVESFVALIVSVAPFLVVALFAFGMRSKKVWVAAICVNVLCLLSLLALLVFARGSEGGGGPLVSGFALAGAFITVNLAYLFWRVPTSAQAVEQRTA